MGAENFTIEELGEAVRYAKIRGVRVYLALNTLFYEHELNAAYDTARRAAETGCDALILQDIGLAYRIFQNRHNFPCEIHASTQMSIYNPEGLQFLKKMGFDRCIAARELSVPEIAALCKEDGIEIEVFCHGALCMSVSGQCLLSSFIGGRSGNRGACAQPCRKKYALCRDGGGSAAPAYRLSPSDFASLPQMQELIKAGVHSLKIEGRLKSPAYVAMATKYYREAIDSFSRQAAFDTAEKLRDLQLLFGRGNFTAGYLLGKLPFSAITFRSAGRVGIPIGKIQSGLQKLRSPAGLPKNLVRFEFEANLDAPVNVGDGVTIYTETGELERIGGGTVNAVRNISNMRSVKITVAGSLERMRPGPYILALTEDKQLRDTAERTLQGEHKKIPVQLLFTAKRGEKPVLTVTDAQGNSVQAAGELPIEQAESAPVSEDRIRQQLVKFGDTPYIAQTVRIEIEPGLFFPLSVLNTLRRNCVCRLSALRAQERGTPENRMEPFRQFRCGTPSPMKGGISLFFFRKEDFWQYSPEALPKILLPYGDESVTYYIPLTLFYQTENRDYRKTAAQIAQLRKNGNCQVVAYFPWISLGTARQNVLQHLPEIIGNYPEIDGFLCENPGDFTQISMAAENAGRTPLVCCDHSFNAANVSALQFLGHNGANRAAITTEADPETAARMAAQSAAAVNPEIIVGGRIALMRSRHCYIDEGECNGKKEKCRTARFALQDEYGNRYPILPQREDCCSILLSDRPVLCTPEELKKIRRICPEATLRFQIG